MIAVPIACAVVGAILPFTPLAALLGFAPLPLEFFFILLAMIVAYLVLVEVVKARFYKVRERPRVLQPTHARTPPPPRPPARRAVRASWRPAYDRPLVERADQRGRGSTAATQSRFQRRRPRRPSGPGHAGAFPRCAYGAIRMPRPSDELRSK